MHRRRFIAAAGALVFPAASSNGAPGREERVAFSEGSEPPRQAMPDPSCDCHMHIYDDRFPAAPNATLRPPNATVDDYRSLQARLGTTRTVVVTPSTYGTDNRMLDALGRFGANARGYRRAGYNGDERRAQSSCRGRCAGDPLQYGGGSVTTIAMIEPLAKRVNDFGWHIQVNMPPDQLVANESLLLRLPTPIVFDHMARPRGNVAAARNGPHGSEAGCGLREGLGQADGTLSRFEAWAAHLSRCRPGRGRSRQARTRADALSTDWPHPTHQQHLRDDAMLVDRFFQWVPDEAHRQRILVDNPQVLYPL